MIRLLLDLIILLFFLIITIPIMPIVPLLRKTGHYELGNRLAHCGAKTLFVLVKLISGTDLVIRGAEHIPDDEGALFVGNHCSYFDIVLSYCAFKSCTGYVGKKELGRYPLLNIWMLLIGCIFLNRDNPRDGVKMIQTASDHIAHKNSMVIFPEGTRNKNEDEQLLLDFHPGSLRIATKAGCKVIPMAISGSADVFEKHIPFVKARRVIIEFAEPIDVSKLDRAAGKQLAQTTHDIIYALRQKHKAELG